MSNTRLTHLLVLAFASLIIAVVCFFLGGLIAEVTNATPIAGLSVKAGGSLAAFIIAFVVLLRAYRSMGILPLSLVVTVGLNVGNFTRSRVEYSAKVTVLKTASGDEKEVRGVTAWEPGGLTVRFSGIEQDDFVRIVLTDDAGGRWESNFFSPLRPSVTLF